MSSFEFLAKNVEKAIKKACDELNLAPDEISYDVLSHGSRGIFGLAGVKKARIRVNLPDKSEEKPEEVVSEVVTTDPEDEISGKKIPTPEYSFENDDSDRQQLYIFEENSLELGRAVLQRIIDAITADAKIAAEENSEGLLFNVTGGNAGILIGKKGQTLEAIQSLVEKIVNKHQRHNDKTRVLVDVEGYLETRKVNLEKLAERLADKSKRIRKPISLGQMSAHDRKIVHLALRNDPDVRTKSRGDGYMRKLVIFPQKSNRPRQRLRSQVK